MTGKKHDQGKVRAGLVLGDFARALWAVSLVGTFGAEKYAESNWLKVENAKKRYDDAMIRHWLQDKYGQTFDDESEILHLAHVAWNALAILELELRDGGCLTKRGMESQDGLYESREDGRTRTGSS